MRILICGINYAPELIGTGRYNAGLAEWLAGQGHSVRMIAAPPYYPGWRVGAGYSSRRYRREAINGVDVWRCPLYVPKRQSGLRRLLHLTSFVVTSCPAMMSQLTWRPEVVLLVAPTLLAAPAALMTARLSGAKAWLHIQDFEFDAAFQLGILEPEGLITGPALRFESWLMKKFDLVSTISGKMVERAIDKGVLRRNVFLFPNWADLDTIKPMERFNNFRKELEIGPEQILLLYAGSIGEKQGLEIILRTARATRNNPKLQYVIAGDGAAKDRLVKMGEENGLANVRFLPPQPENRFTELLAAADIHLVVQKKSAADLVLPSKVVNIMAAGRPLVVTAEADTQLGELTDQNGFGLRVEPESADALGSAIEELVAKPEDRETMGKAARTYAEMHLNKEKIMAALHKRLAD